MRFTRNTLTISVLFATFLAAVAPAQENAWRSHGPTGPGYVFDLAIAGGVAHAATENGVFRSSDGGATWQQSGLAGETTAYVLALPGATFALTGDFYSYHGKGFHVSRDGGETWGLVPGLPPIVAADVDPWQPSTLYAGAVDGTIRKSTDAGATWQILPAPGDAPLLRAFAFNSGTIYVLSNFHLFKSVDGGISWTSAQPPFNFVATIATGAANGVVYSSGYSDGQQGFCRSTDSAVSWTCSSVLGYPNLIFEVPGEVPRVFANSHGPDDGPFETSLYVSSDGGATWAGTAGKLGSNVYAFASDASGTLLLAGTFAGIFRSEDRGDTWTPSSAGLHLPTSINSLALDPQNPSTVWAGTPEAGVFWSPNGGRSWSPAGGQGELLVERTLAVDPEVSSTLYAWTTSGVSRSDDGGATWSSPSLLDRSIQGNYFRNALAVDPGSSGRVWASAWTSGLFHSDDGARTWESLSLAQDVFCILFDEKRPGTIYLGSYYDTDYSSLTGLVGGSIFVSRDSGASFTKFTVNQSRGLYDVTSIAADPFDDNVLYAGTRIGGVYRSADAGRSWQAPLQPIRADSLVADPVRPGRLYATTTDAGVLRTTDGAQSWHDFSAGLGALGVGPLVISPDGTRLHVGTNAAGVFELDLEIGDEALDVSSGAAGRSRILFWDSDQLSVQTLAESGSWTSTPFEGPYSGWNAIAIADGSDGLSRVLWQNVDGRVGLELVGPAGKVDAFRFDAEPGWKAIDVSLGSDGRTHLLRTSADGKMRITSVDSSGSAVEGQLYGPYDGWSAHAIDDGPDGATWVLWQRVNGHAGIARYRAGTVETAFRWDANPGWSAEDIAVGADGVARVLWTNPDGRMEITSVDGQGHLFDRKVHSNVGLKARRIAGSPDGLTRVLWTGMDRGSSLWILNPDNSLKSQDPIPAP